MKWSVAISFAGIVLLAANIALVRQNQQLKTQLSQPPPAFEVVTGTQVPDLRGFDAVGKPLEVLYGKDPRKVLVLVFSPTCGFCDENWPKWQQVMATLDRAGVRPVAVDVTSTASQAFMAQHQLQGMPVFVQVDPRATVNYRFHLTPQTILVGREGKVERVWTGVLNDSAMAELKRLLSDNKSASAQQSSGFLTERSSYIMVKKIAKTTLFATILATVVSAGTVSALQLHKGVKAFGVCRGLCSATVACSGPCFCYIPSGTTGSCVSDPPGARPATK